MARDPILISVDEAAALLGVSRRTVYRLVNAPDPDDRLAVVRLSSQRMKFRVEDVEAFVARRSSVEVPS